MTVHVMLVIPAFNEAARLDLAALNAALEQIPNLGFVLVDDGSRDATAELMDRLALAWPDRVTVERLGRNFGKAHAVWHGLRHPAARAARVTGYWDADLATPLEELPSLLAPLEANVRVAVVIASRVRMLGRSIERRALRHLLGRIFATAASLLLRVPVYDTQCGAKLFRQGPALQGALAAPFATRWIFDVELLSRLGARLNGGLEACAVEVPVQRWADIAGSRVRPRDFLRAALDLAHLAWRTMGRRGEP